MSAVHLADLAGVVGARVLSLQASAAEGRLRSRPETLRQAGFEVHRLAQPGETAADLARAALAPLAPRHRDAGALVLGGTIPLAPRTGASDVRTLVDLDGARLLDALGLERAHVATIGGQACTSGLGALRIAAALVAAEPRLGAALVASADRVPDGVPLEQGFCPLSDGAVAGVVTTEPRGWRLLDFDAVVHGALADASDDHAMGRLFPIVHALVTGLLQRNGRSARDLARLVPPNLPRAASRVLARSLGLDEERAASPTLASHGHVLSCDPLLNLLEIERRGESREGDLVVLLSAGYGLTWQAALLERVS